MELGSNETVENVLTGTVNGLFLTAAARHEENIRQFS